MEVSSIESYSIFSTDSPRVKLASKMIEVELDNFDKYKYSSDCDNTTSFGFELEYKIKISEGKELVFPRF